jgi:DNA-binding transcriptional regulator YiaG
MRQKHKARPLIGPRKARRTAPGSVAARIAAKRLRLGLSQEEAAAQIGVSVRSLIRWEFGAVPSALARRPLDAWLRKGGA